MPTRVHRVFPRTYLVSLATVTATAAAAPASAAAAAICAPARVGPSVAAQPEPWQRAVAELVEATRDEQQPWGCLGGEIDLVVREGGGATLTVRAPDGRTTAREIASPDDVVPLGEALLAKPLHDGAASGPKPQAPSSPSGRPETSDTPLPAPKTEAPPPVAPVAVKLPGEPRVILSALVAPRYAGHAQILWGGLSVGALVPIHGWGVGAWVRYDALSASLGERRSPMSEICVGAVGSRSFHLGRVELRASVSPSLAVITRDTGPRSPDETRVDGRIGVEARVIVPITPLVRIATALDTELAPREFADDGDRADKVRGFDAPFPTYTVGLGVGVEFALR